MNLTTAEVAELPLAAALVEGGELLASTPEWRGPTPGTVSFVVHSTRLLVSTDAAPAACAGPLAELLDALDAAGRDLPHRAGLRVAMLAAGLRVLTGRGAASPGTSIEVLEHAAAGIGLRTGQSVAIERSEAFTAPDPALAALVLVQFASNAERHDHADSVSLAAAESSFTVSWRAPGGTAPAMTARRRADRSGWGLGFARLAADALGAVVHTPLDSGGPVSSCLEVGLRRLALPVALLRSGVVVKATRAWDEETALLPGSGVPSGSRVGACVAAAALRPGEVVTVDGWCARTGRDGTWAVVPPAPVVDRVRDVLDGLVHERVLWQEVAEPARSRIAALAALLAALLGGPLDRVPASAWNRRAARAAEVFGVSLPVPEFRGVGAVDPRIAMWLASAFAEAIEARGDDLFLRIAARHRDNLVVRQLAGADGMRVKLS